MFKRLVWMGMGATIGAGATLWADWRVRRALAQLGPDSVARQAGRRLQAFSRDLDDALAEGRAAMRDREAELRRGRDRRPTREPAGQIREAPRRHLQPVHLSPEPRTRRSG